MNHPTMSLPRGPCAYGSARGAFGRTFRYCGQFVVHPLRAADAVASDPQGLWSGLWLGILFLAAYALTVLIYYFLGHQPMAQPFLRIPLERWYLVQSFTTVPMGMAAFLSYAGVAYLVCRAWGGRGSWDATVGSSVYGLVLPWVFFTLSFELLVAPLLIAGGARALPWPQWVETLRIFVLPILWMFGLCLLALMRVHRISWWKSLIAVVAGTIPLAGIMAVFIR